MSTIGPKIVLEGEKEYRQAITDVNNSMKVLKSELRATSAAFDGNANSIDALRKKNEILVKQQTEQEKKLSLLKGALQEATKQYGENSKQAQSWQIKLNNAHAELSKLNHQLDENDKHMKEAERSTDKTAKSIDEFGREVKDAKQETLGFGDVLKANLTGEAIVTGIRALGNAMKGVATTAVNLVKDTAAYADNILTLSDQTGIATDTLQELNYMAELTDTSIETITSSMARNIRSMKSAKEGTQLYVEAYKELGIEVTDANGNLKDSEAIFWQSIDALGKMANETERDATAMQLFGRSAQDLNPLIAVGSQKMAEFAAEAHKMGAVLSSETLDKLGEADDAIQRWNQQLEISKRIIALEMAPAMTEALEKLTQKIGEADDEFADFASGALEDLVNGFIWLVDNADKLEAGLKGITAAIITKKTADGVIYAVNAYKTLTAATQSATAAQVAFNTASKANVYALVASLVIGAGTALISYAKSAKEAKEETEKLDAETEKLIENSRRLREEVDRKKEAYREETESIEAEYGALDRLSDKLFELVDKEKKTNSEKQQMVSLVKQLNEAMPDLNLQLNEQNGLLNIQRGELEKLVDAQKELYLVRAAEKRYTELAEERASAEIQLNNLYVERAQLYGEIIQKQYEYNSIPESGFLLADNARFDEALGIKKELIALQAEYSATGNSVTQLEGILRENDKQWDDTNKYISNLTGATEEAGNAIDAFGAKYQKSLDEQGNAELRSIESRTEQINDIYKAAGKELDKLLKAEEKAFTKSQERRTEAVREAQEEELSELETSHKKKLELINDEYLAKIKLVDEDRYKELKAVQDEIDKIDNQQEAESRALKLREDAEKKAELMARVNNAKTAEERVDAQKELKRFEESLGRERVKDERKVQKDVLGVQLDAINDKYDAEVENLKAEQKAKEDVSKADYEAKKKDVQARHKLVMEVLKDELDAERDNLKEKQADYKEYLADQKAAALKNSKEIYDEDLKKFKLNQAAKYTDVTSSEAEMKKAIQKYAYNNMQPGKDRDAILKTSDLNEMLKYYNPTAALTTAQPTAGLTPAQIETAMTRAIKKLNLVVQLDSREVGRLIDNNLDNKFR